jgi:hypothetical protein
MYLASAVLAASIALAGCNRGATTNNAAAPANKAAPAAPAGNAAGGNAAGGESAGAQTDDNFTVTNQTGHVLTTLNVSPTGEASWGPDILGRDVLANGESAEITFGRDENRCFWDIRATYDDGGETVAMNQNLCELDSLTMVPGQ